MPKILLPLLLVIVLANSLNAGKSHPTWSVEKANDWYSEIDWPVGVNFVPSTAINQLEMWQEDTFDPKTIDRELAWAASIGMNTMRVFLHDLAWKQDPKGFLQRVDQYLEIADSHGIRTMLVFFDGVWHPYPKAGKQMDPIPGLHNSGWLQSPGRIILEDDEKIAALEPYVKAVLKRFKDDDRVLIWDLFNEPENANGGSYGPDSEYPDLPKEAKMERVTVLLKKVFQWAREVELTQPITVGLWGAPRWLEEPLPIDQLIIDHSDIISFHSYRSPEETQRMVDGLKKLGRPLMCTEYVAREHGSTFQTILPIFAKDRVGAYNWGLVDGKTQTIFPWKSWKEPFKSEPEIWHHEVFRKDGTPYSEEEVSLIKKLTSEVE